MRCSPSVRRRWDTRRTTSVTILAAASGFIVITLQIAYLPALYAAYNRRETLITLLTSRAGEPAWGPEILIRHQLVGIIDALPDFYASWEQWSAEVSESHTTYPSLLLFRSPDPWASWIIAQLVGPRRRRHAPRPVSEHRAVTGPAVPEDGIHAHCGASPTRSAGSTTPTRCPTRRCNSPTTNSPAQCNSWSTPASGRARTRTRRGRTSTAGG